MSDRRLRILFAAPVWAPSRAFGGPVVAAGELVRRLVARGHAVDVVTTTITDLADAAGAPLARRDRRRGDGPLSRHAAALPLDGNHADAAPRARTLTPARRCARVRLPRPRDDGGRDVVPPRARAVRLRAAGDVRAETPEGVAEAHPRRDALPGRRTRSGRSRRRLGARTGRGRGVRRRPPRRSASGATAFPRRSTARRTVVSASGWEFRAGLR